jgi:hypothetical protein
MSFRRAQNTHDQWRNYCQSHENLLLATALPRDLFQRRELLEDFLEHGSFCDASGAHTVLSEVSDEAFIALEEFINGYFDFQQKYSVLQQERFRRFRRYA